jgi:DNA-binding beta-propeller fold protein YncE
LAALAAAQGRGTNPVPRFEVEALWPKPLPNHQILGSVTGVATDAQDHIWVVHRGLDSLGANEKGPTLNPPAASCCFSAPQILEFDPAGNLLGHWGGPGQGFEWPQSPSGIAVDSKGNVWIGGGQVQVAATAGARAARGVRGAAPPAEDAQVLKFSKTGSFLLQIGHAGKPEGSDSTTGLNRPANVEVDSAANEVYVADGYVNRRIVVFDATTGAYKRHWGAYGEKPDDSSLGPYDPNAPPAKQFRTVSCVRIAKDGLVYVCDRQNDRIQVFQKNGKFVKEAFVSKTTTGDGSVWDIAFSNDPQQRFIYVADGHDKKVWVLTRETLAVATSFGDGGRLPGLFYGVGSIAVDSKGNVYTGENYEGKRVQKFANKGTAAASNQTR